MKVCFIPVTFYVGSCIVSLNHSLFLKRQKFHAPHEFQVSFSNFWTVIFMIACFFLMVCSLVFLYKRINLMTGRRRKYFVLQFFWHFFLKEGGFSLYIFLCFIHCGFGFFNIVLFCRHICMLWQLFRSWLLYESAKRFWHLYAVEIKMTYLFSVVNFIVFDNNHFAPLNKGR